MDKFEFDEKGFKKLLSELKQDSLRSQYDEDYIRKQLKINQYYSDLKKHLKEKGFVFSEMLFDFTRSIQLDITDETKLLVFSFIDYLRLFNKALGTKEQIFLIGFSILNEIPICSISICSNLGVKVLNNYFQVEENLSNKEYREYELILDILQKLSKSVQFPSFRIIPDGYDLTMQNRNSFCAITSYDLKYDNPINSEYLFYNAESLERLNAELVDIAKLKKEFK